MGFRLGIDSGGTFTDVVLFDESTGKVDITKTPSTPQNASIGVFNGITKILTAEKVDPQTVSSLIHGTTVATNALLEYKGVPAAVLLTSGFKDILSIVRQDRPSLYDYFIRRPDPLIPRRRRYEVEERVLYDGTVAQELNEGLVREIIGELKSKSIGAVAVCLLHSYANPDHEIRIKELFRELYPEASVSLSCEILPEIREYERMSTTAINAYVMPIIERYLADLQERMKEAGLSVELNVMQSNGGIMTSSAAGQKSVATILSGPAGGVIGSQGIANLAGFKDIITLDMGGTSADICLIKDGQFMTTKESEIGGHAIKVPMIDINTIGAGGGSIAWIDPGGLIRVGPRSAGASPGPACYGLGGEEPTVTDANLVLQRIDPEYYVGGEMNLDMGLARQAIEEKVAKPLGLTLEKAAEGIIRIVNANMVRGIRRVSVERGHDPRDFALFCFGGGGPLHGVELARELNIPRVICPISPGVNSAVGLLVADFRYDFSKTYLTRVSNLDREAFNKYFEEMEAQALDQMRTEQVPRDKIVFRRSLDMRYHGQGYEVEVPLDNEPLDEKGVEKVCAAFNTIHRQLYGYDQPGEEVEMVYLRLAVIGLVTKPEFYREDAGGRDSSTALKGKRPVFSDGGFMESAIYDRAKLKPGNHLTGPAIVEQFDSTTFIKSGDKVSIDEYYNLIIDL